MTLLLDRGADVHVVHGSVSWPSSGLIDHQAIDMAVWGGRRLCGNLDIARLLVYRSTPLAWAARANHPKMVEFLLSRGAPVSLPDDEPWATPLAWATRRGHTQIVEMLKKSASP